MDGTTLFPLIGLYAEIHFRFFPFFPSFLFKRQPEILFDLPRRIEPGSDLPVVLILNDIDRYKVEVDSVSVSVNVPGSKPVLLEFDNPDQYKMDHPFTNKQSAYLFTVPRIKLPNGLFYVNAKLNGHRNRKKIVVLNDNLPGTSKLAFSCFASKDSLPGSALAQYGDLHIHSIYSESHVEFGPPVSIIDTVAAASGLEFAAITDHSYDLACKTDNYLKLDHSNSRFSQFINEWNPSNPFKTIMLPGEEISCRNSKGDVVHLCAVNIRSMIPGSLDGARKGRHREQTLGIAEAIDEITNQGGIAVAAHPGASVSFLEKLFLNRGTWMEEDYHKPVHAFQILNSGFSTASFKRGWRSWINLLLHDIYKPLAAGNDAHGDFNRYRAIAKPFISISENRSRFMGCSKTGIYSRTKTRESVCASIAAGSTFITNGPYLSLCSFNNPSRVLVSCINKTARNEAVAFHGLSTPEFGGISSIVIFAGSSRLKTEAVIVNWEGGPECFEILEKIPTEKIKPDHSYLRAEITTISHESGSFHGLTGAVILES